MLTLVGEPDDAEERERASVAVQFDVARAPAVSVAGSIRSIAAQRTLTLTAWTEPPADVIRALIAPERDHLRPADGAVCRWEDGRSKTNRSD